jgi:hypothetical protein
VHTISSIVEVGVVRRSRLQVKGSLDLFTSVADAVMRNVLACCFSRHSHGQEYVR